MASRFNSFMKLFGSSNNTSEQHEDRKKERKCKCSCCTQRIFSVFTRDENVLVLQLYNTMLLRQDLNLRSLAQNNRCKTICNDFKIRIISVS